jgi:hypothetical protein
VVSGIVIGVAAGIGIGIVVRVPLSSVVMTVPTADAVAESRSL